MEVSVSAECEISIGNETCQRFMPAEKREERQQAIKHDRYGRRNTGHERGGCCIRLRR